MKIERFPDPLPIEWRENKDFCIPFLEAFIDNECVASLEKRPYYCDRGHFWVKCWLPGLDGADMFPRYYMKEDIARAETEAFLKWRLWKQRGASK